MTSIEPVMNRRHGYQEHEGRLVQLIEREFANRLQTLDKLDCSYRFVHEVISSAAWSVRERNGMSMQRT